ncbi:glyoxalase (plasmid) [Rhizobium leguminosarum]|nr:VOC family protein [Rhizobium leguminosarum]QIO76705.1 glyoxalase [Rhizobium leguminosarum bv. trifolii]QIO83725.1 glyoxalase [Rhizobium leguminosarum bv. trifolii]TAU16933.1 glyoxalase [Rhizobium leguminosarum]TAU34874.1 glyoxalase [Rhizobium leguminosarum]TAX44318.1 glyoxalase [Rhizobium leguminosarum]
MLDARNPAGQKSDLAEEASSMALEIAVIGVTDVDRAKEFYSSLGWRFDIDVLRDDYRVVQFTPPGSGCSVMFGKNVTAAEPGSSRGLHLVVTDLEGTRRRLLEHGIPVGEPFHDAGGIFHHANGLGMVAGMNPERKSYASFMSFRDPDGNEWTVQEVTARLPGRLGSKRFTPELAEAVRGTGE